MSDGSARHPELPAWWQPLLSELEQARTSDFTPLSTPARGARESAVLILLGEEGPDTGPDVLVLQRAETLRNHAGQPAFPGGAADPDDGSAAGTALREATEEVGLDPTTVDVVTQLPTLWIPVSDFLVSPVLAWWRDPHEVRPVDTAEVARVERLPIRELVDPQNRLQVRHYTGRTGPAFRVRGMLVWGFTAGILSRLLEMGGWAVPWDTDRIEDMPATGPAPVG